MSRGETVRRALPAVAARSGPFSWAQLEITNGYREDLALPPETRPNFDLHATLHLRGRWRLPIDDLLRALTRVAARHECFRTTVHDLAEPRPAQRVNPAETFPIVVGEVRSDGGADVLAKEFGREMIDVGGRHLVRIGVTGDRGTGENVVIAASRLLVDGWGFSNLARDVMREIGTGGHGAEPPAVFHQLDQVAWEEGPAGRARTAAAIAHREQVADRLRAAAIVPRTRLSPDLGQEARCEGAAVTRLCDRIATRLSTSPSTVLLAAFCHTVARRLDQRAVGVTLSYADRGDARRQSSVTRLKSEATMLYTDGTEPDTVFRDTFAAALTAYTRAGVDPFALRRAGVSDGLLRAQNVRFEFNDARGQFHRNDRSSGTPRAAHPPPERRPDPRVRTVLDGKPPRLGLWVGPSFSDFAGKTSLTVRTNILTKEETAAVLRGILDVLWEAAA
ncbi:hypothetical protein [Actinoplanes sp. NPDC051851]|uniref:hypothetical protein n=1 Tax=Actinoplanes sp. NPDC051851 TaxID=3154753 RepID=UPI00341386D6